MVDKNKLVDAFFEWYKNNDHSKKEDFYTETINKKYLSQLSKKDFIDFFSEFKRDGGFVQSRGHRTVDRFVREIEKNYEEFRNKILESFEPNFNLSSWLQWAENFNFFGKGSSTIFLNRVDKYKYVIVNNKSVDGLRKLGFDIPEVTLTKQYQYVLEAEQSLQREFLTLDNFYKIDALLHFIIGVPEGMFFFKETEIMEYFDIEGMKKYASKVRTPYSKEDPASKWYIDTQKKLEYLIVELLQERLDETLDVNYREKPLGQGGKGKIIFKDYVLIGFAPKRLNPEKFIFIKIEFRQLSGLPAFCMEIDINTKIKPNPYAATRDKIVATTTKSITVDESFPKTWDSLLDTIQDEVDNLITKYESITSEAHMTSSEQAKLRMTLNEKPSTKLNTILYGPPGTGKTFHSINYAVAILEGNKDVELVKSEKREDVKNRFTKFINEGRIAFCTFHQSMSYEDFIEGIKPLPPNDDDRNTLSYDIRDGLFMRMCVEAAYNFIVMNSLYDEKFSELLSFNELYDQLVDEISSAGEMELTTINQSKVTVTVSDRGNIEVKHVNGERTYTVSRERLSLLYERYPDLKGINNIVTDFRNIIGGCNATAFWSVLNKMVSMKQSNKLADQVKDPVAVDYKQKAKVVKEYWKKKEQYPVDFQDKSKPFVLIIDEINRGNVSQIFGELVTLIEDDKRIGKTECLYADLTYSQKSFSVPPNLHIIGTMNTADRSVEALDTALRRRFAFEPVMPDLNELDAEFENINVRKLLETLNNRLRILKDNDHTIGHAWLMGINDFDGLRNVFKNKILPLLQEYFYNDYEKLGLVLGDAFFKLPHKHVDGKEFALFSGNSGLSGQYRSKYVYELKNADELNVADFLTLCQVPITND